ncbi:MAG: hypothetical protein MRY72_05795 [Aquisalinus sp.]|nr:hypothetical protein [Aquisalinus sp.]
MSQDPTQHSLEANIDAQYDQLQSSQVISNLAALFYFRTGPLAGSTITLGLCLPLFFLVFAALSLLVIVSPMDVLAIWLDARAIMVGADALTVASQALVDGNFLHLMFVNMAAVFEGTPGEILLRAQGMMAIVMVLPLAYGATMRLPLLPAVIWSLFVIMMVLVPPQGALTASSAFSSAIFLWLGLITWARPHKAMLRCAQAEGLVAGLGLWILYMSALPLFVVAIIGLVAALILQQRRGLVFILMTSAVFLILAACSELLCQMLLGNSLFQLRVQGLTVKPEMVDMGLPHLLAVVISTVAILTRSANSLMVGALLIVLMVMGGFALVVVGFNPLPAFLLVVLIATFGHTNSHERNEMLFAPRSALSGTLSLSVISLSVLSLAVFEGSKSLTDQYKAQPLEQAEMLGFSFASEPHYARLIIERQLDPIVLTKGVQLSAADQALLMGEGLSLAAEMHQQQRAVALVSGGDLSLLAAPYLTAKEAAQFVLAPRIAIDTKTDEARISAQPVLYTQYRKAPKSEQLSPVYELWVRQ